ncbi:hypothetical protein [Devosia naphthalenivorans]|uniref:hypothetical protein n=1 Tax=Devosia naphthalenivorans TaxID=2082392 RepID=UPI000D3A35F9|nr:hypothetical protein [Devosia naphthalenivorans]
MNRTVLAASTITLAIAMSAPTLAQVTINGRDVPANQVAQLEEYCFQLSTDTAVADTGSPETDLQASEEEVEAQAGGGATEGEVATDEPPADARKGEPEATDFSDIDLQACIESGLVQAGANGEAGFGAEEPAVPN